MVLVIGWRYESSSAGAPAPEPPRSSYPAAASTPSEPPVLVVDVAGAVRHAGVYRLATGARIQDAIRRAHPLGTADLSTVNLAARLTDGEQVVVPRRGAAGADAAAGGAGPTASGPVSINSGSLEQLETLDGIGPALAQRIVDYRAAHGGFRSLDQLDQVSGIGPAHLAALRGHVTL